MKLKSLPAGALAALAGIITVAAVSGTVYAVSYLWPQLGITTTPPATTPSGRQAVEVFGEDCPDISNKKYELKKVAPFGPEKIADVIKAECEIESIRRWADSEYPDYALTASRITRRPDMTPGKEVTQKSLNFPQALKVKAISPTEITFEKIDEWNPARPTLAISPSVKFIVNRQYGKASDIKVGDAVAYLSLNTSVNRNNDNCTEERCGTTPISQTEELAAIIKLQQPFEDYDKFGSLAELMECPGNPKDHCHTGNTASIEIYTNLNTYGEISIDGPREIAQIEGTIESIAPDGLMLKTPSGRTVKIATSYDIVGQFNRTRAADHNTTVGIGDTVQVDYIHDKAAKNDENITTADLARISVLIEINSKADLKPDTSPNKF